jgi:hypothetical protein
MLTRASGVGVQPFVVRLSGHSRLGTGFELGFGKSPLKHFSTLFPSFLSQKTRKSWHALCASMPFRHSGMVLAGIQDRPGVDSG